MEKCGNIDPRYTPETEPESAKQAGQSSPSQRLEENHVQTRLVEAAQKSAAINVNRK